MASPTNPVYPNLTVQFTDLSTNDITEWRWDFNGDAVVDNTYYQSTNPLWTYPSINRSYNVTLTTIGPGGMDTETKLNYISVTGCPT